MGRIRDRIAQRRAQRAEEAEIEEQLKSDEAKQAADIKATAQSVEEARKRIEQSKPKEQPTEQTKQEVKKQPKQEQQPLRRFATPEVDQKIKANTPSSQSQFSEQAQQSDRDLQDEINVDNSIRQLDKDAQVQAKGLKEVGDDIEYQKARNILIKDAYDHLTDDQKKVFNTYDNDEDRVKYLDSLGVGVEDKEDKSNLAERVWNKGEDKRTLNEYGKQRNYDYQTAGEQTSPLVDMIHSGNSFVDAYRSVYARPQAPEYDPKREKALNWQKAIVALGKLGGIIADTVQMSNGGRIMLKPQGQTEIDHIDSAINSLRNEFASQYASYLEADKLYLKGLYDAYKTDAQQRINTGKEMAKKFDIDKSYSYADAETAKELATIRARKGVGRSGTNNMVRVAVYGRDNNKNQNLIYISKNELPIFTGLMSAQFVNDKSALFDFLTKYGKDLDGKLHGFSLENLHKIQNDPDLTDEEKKLAKDEIISRLFSNSSDEYKIREYVQKYFKDNPYYCVDWAVKTGNKQAMDYAEAYGGLPAGSLSLGAEDRIDIINRIVDTFPSEERIQVRETLRKVPLTELAQIYQDRTGDIYQTGGNGEGTRTQTELPQDDDENPKVIKIGDNYYFYDDPQHKTPLTKNEVELLKKAGAIKDDNPKNNNDNINDEPPPPL